MKQLFRLAPGIMLACSLSSAAFINGGFETGDLTGWSSLGSAVVSTGNDYGNGAIVTPDEGVYSLRLSTAGVSVSDIALTMGVDDATVAASNPGTTPTNGSLIWQTVSATAGDVFQFRWNFVEQDYLPYDDWAFFGVSLNGAPAVLEQFASLATVGPDDNGATANGWVTKTVNISTTGTYTFYFGVVNGQDTSLDSDLWIDSSYAGTTPPNEIEPGEVPEPATVLMMLAGLACIAVRARRRKA